jgi:hypothetical protein
MIITAKELFNKMLEENDECTSTEMMIEFAQRHVTEALKQAYEKAETKWVKYTENDYEIDKDSILSSYSLKNVK